ncbi:MAG TPA: VOC family protein [Bryobacteraceae bacterium]|nr:VOC family protein [Bryobacteraceae bacterium]
MELNPILSFNGHCEEAFRCYEACLDGRISFLMKYGDLPGQEARPGLHEKVFHATLTLDKQVLQGSDVAPEDYVKPQGFTLRLGLTDPAEVERVFNVLAEGGTVQMPLEQTFWALRFGVLVDKFGIPWAISCEKP